MKLLTKEILKQFKKVGCQSNSSDPIVILKLFNPCGSQTWWITEYDEKSRLFFCFVTGMDFDEWGYTSQDELESLKLPFGLSIERDMYFRPIVFSEVKKRYASYFQKK